MEREMKGIVRPPLGVPPSLRERKPKPRQPFLLRLITLILILRALTYIALFYVLWTFPNSVFAAYLVANSDFFFKRTPQVETVETALQSGRDFLMTGFLLIGVVYSVIAWKWWTRHWLARWGAIFLAGATLINTVIGLVADRTSGLDSAFTPEQMRTLIAGSILNLAIVLYLVFYPGVSEVFKES